MDDLQGRTHNLQGVLFEHKRLSAQVWKVFHMKISMMYFLASKAPHSNTYNCVGVTFGCMIDCICASCWKISKTAISGNALPALIYVCECVYSCVLVSHTF